ncbi:MAG: hypothetical protein EOO78_33260 [Oxalobacteraceae bacterium]|nr:MAG: hypothetical protein EOO78_33260 [Oxalobacteraceae bacterium]
MTFNYIHPAIVAIGRPYLSAIPVLVTLATRIGFGVALFDGGLTGFAWALCWASLAATPIVIMQQQRYFHWGLIPLLRAMVPSAWVAAGTAAAGALLNLVIPDWPALVRLLVMLTPLALFWYLMLRVTRHELLDEVHRMAATVKMRLGRLLPTV